MGWSPLSDLRPVRRNLYKSFFFIVCLVTYVRDVGADDNEADKHGEGVPCGDDECCFHISCALVENRGAVCVYRVSGQSSLRGGTPRL